MKIFRILIVLMALVSGFYACVNKENETRDNAIDSTLQTSATAILEETVIQTVSILNKPDYLKFYFRINT